MEARQEMSELVGYLHNYICEVTFTKRDGTERVMRCTLRSSILKELEEAKTSNNSKNSKSFGANIIRVFDLDNNGWRSFDHTTVKRFVIKGSSQ